MNARELAPVGALHNMAAAGATTRNAPCAVLLTQVIVIQSLSALLLVLIGATVTASLQHARLVPHNILLTALLKQPVLLQVFTGATITANPVPVGAVAVAGAVTMPATILKLPTAAHPIVAVAATSAAIQTTGTATRNHRALVRAPIGAALTA